MRGMLGVIEKVLLTGVGFIMVVILGDTALRYLDAREGNPIVDWFRRWAEGLTPLPAIDVLQDQQDWQTAVLSVALWALAAGLFVMLFKALRSGVDRLEAHQADEQFGR